MCCVQKLCPGTNEFELSVVELPYTVIGKILDQCVLSRHDLLEIETDFPGANAPRPGVAGQMHHFRRVKQRLGGHAAAQNAQPADLVATFDDDGFQTRARRRPCRRVAAAAAAEDRHVIIKSVHAKKMEAISNLTIRFNSLTIQLLTNHERHYLSPQPA